MNGCDWVEFCVRLGMALVLGGLLSQGLIKVSRDHEKTGDPVDAFVGLITAGIVAAFVVAVMWAVWWDAHEVVEPNNYRVEMIGGD